MTDLVLGPLLRHVDDTSATVWVETPGPGRVTVRAGDREASAGTFAAHGHHYALVELTGLAPGSRTAYAVEVDGHEVWPSQDPEQARFGPSVIATLQPGRPLRMAFGSCRVSLSHDAEGNAVHGVDALRAFALEMADGGRGEEAPDWPDLVLFLGDQVYADETSPKMKEFIEQRRDPSVAPWYELKDYEEYAHLYHLAWTDPANRWLLSTLPSAMIFDDHDIRDDWNTSVDWRRKMESTSWWHDRVVSGLGSYWVHQHLGNLSPAERAEDALWQRVRSHEGEGELDITDALDELADAADQHPDSYRWSFCRDFDTQARLVVVDSRAARVLTPERRSILDEAEMDWLDERMRGDVDHLLVGTSLPFLMGPGLHHGEAFGEALAEGAWGRALGSVGEKLRQAVDLEHWAAFQEGFVRLASMTLEVAAGRRGRAPGTITFLSGDVHHSYVAEAWPEPHSGIEVSSAIVQAVCSPIRNPLPPAMRVVMKVAALGTARPRGRVLGGKVPRSPLWWRFTSGPWYDNNLAVLEVRGRRLRMRWWRGQDRGRAPDDPALELVAGVEVGP